MNHFGQFNLVLSCLERKPSDFLFSGIYKLRSILQAFRNVSFCFPKKVLYNDIVKDEVSSLNIHWNKL